jgi:hypothetical protein
MVTSGLDFWGTFWATFAGGLAAALVSIVGIIIVERVRARQEREREQRATRERRIERRRASRNAAKAVRMELFAAARPLERVSGGHGAWEPMVVARIAWDDQANRMALIDLLTDEALFEIEHAYHELEGLWSRLDRDPDFMGQLAHDGWKLGRRILETHVHPALDHLHIAVAGVETLELAHRGELAAEAARLKEEGAGEKAAT